MWKKLTVIFQIKGAKKLQTENYFCVHHKNRRKRYQQFKLLFSKIIYILKHQTGYLHVRYRILLLKNNIYLAKIFICPPFV